ncbi:MAG: type II 3-dehydroquinate dehydratase [Nitrospirae bacterium]|jgi:3-dehydroquinate dehydratase-2|nr:type II 3-dehydroquinate dehydratase [Nitrospirota bacterium]
MIARILVLNGPNLNRLGKREPSVYGQVTLEKIENGIRTLAAELSVEVDFFQSNHEGALIDRIHLATDKGVDGFLVNPGALTHTSIALRDALLSAGKPFVEVHISNTYAREPYRHESFLSDVSSGVLVGFGTFGYQLALRGLTETIRKKQEESV